MTRIIRPFRIERITHTGFVQSLRLTALTFYVVVSPMKDKEY